MMKLLKKTFSILVILLVIFSTVNVTKVNAVNTTGATYKVRQITNENEITSSSGNEYLIVYEEDNVNYALASTVKEDSPLFAMGLDNAEEVDIENDTLTYNGEQNILWLFTKSLNSVSEGEDKPVIEAATSVYDGDNEVRKQLEFSVTNTQRNPAGIEYTSNGYTFNFHFDSNGYVKLEQNNGIAKYSYLRFLSSDKRFLSSTPGKAAKVKIYEVVKNYTPRGEYKVSNIESEPQYPNPGSVSINKVATVSNKYEENGIATVKLETIAQPIKKNTDVVLILDDSNSVYEKIDENSEARKVDTIKNTASEFASKVLEFNSDNRIAVVKFAGEIIDKQETENLGFSKDIEKITELINKDKTNFDGGTNYTEAFREANELLETVAPENRDSVVVFISDGAPSIYNRLKYTVYKETTDGEVGHHADNWVNYFLNNELKENTLMKEAGTKIYTIGSKNSDKAITSTGAFVVNSEDTKQLLQNLSTGKSYFYDWANMPEELENIYNDIFKDFYIYPKDSKVTDVLGEDVVLLNKNTNELNPKIQIKHGEEIVEEITFNEAGTEAYSTLQQDKNIMTAEGDTYKIESNYVAYDSNSKTFSWNIGNIDNTGYSLEYFVYLTETVNLYNDGRSRQTGKYDTNKEAYLEYINHLNENIRKDFPVPQIDWKLINESGEVIKTGDNIIYYVSVLGILVLLLGINKIRKIVVK